MEAQELEHPERSDDDGLGNILGGHGDLVVPFLQVKPRKNILTSYSRGEISNVR